MCWRPAYILVLFVLIGIDFWVGLTMLKTPDKRKRKIYLTLSLLSNLSILFFFKYFGLFQESLNFLLDTVHAGFHAPAWSLVLPIGVSFHTFQAMGYSVDVYEDRILPERNLGIFALFVFFFPQLVAGPIERAKRLIPQFYERHSFEIPRALDGLKLMAWGYFKKWVVADRLTLFVQVVYSHPTYYQGFPLMLATLLFAFQIYADFSGYSDIALGAAQIMGFRLVLNFNRPYSSKSVSEFWKRWHISLSSWFRDYVYIPLGGNRTVKWRWYYNILITFALSGLWHGARWNFLLWGVLNGFYLIGSIWTAPIRKSIVSLIGISRLPVLHGWLQRAITFSLICFSWIFFRANTFHDARYIAGHLFTGWGEFVHHLSELPYLKANVFLNQGPLEFLIAVFAVFFMEVVQAQNQDEDVRSLCSKQSLWRRWMVYYVVCLSVLFLGVFRDVEFIYFQF